jgi:hypothetical protein
MRGHMDRLAVKARLGFGADRRPHRLRQINRGFARTGMSQPNHDLAGSNDLARFDKRLHHCAVGVSEQQGVATFVAGDLRISLSRGELRIGAIERRPRLLVSLLG